LNSIQGTTILTRGGTSQRHMEGEGNQSGSAVLEGQGLEPQPCGLWFCDLSQIPARADAHDRAGPTSQICVRLLN